MAEVAAAPPVIKVVGLCGSLRKGSSNRGLLRAAAEIARSIEGLEVEYVDISALPFVNADLEANGAYPPIVEAFRMKVRAAHGVLFASPEYNYSLSGPLKNAIDWASRPPNVWADKSAAVVSSSGGTQGQRARYHLCQIGVYLDLHFINQPEICLNAHLRPAKFDGDGNLIDDSIRQTLEQVVRVLYAFTLRLQGK
ncbi:NADPH:quinone oxidoreductase [Perilla frutescens var. frutescens]|nr:NADPH:quinone oxidoreductase [Perilla frutescens var. frutescens]